MSVRRVSRVVGLVAVLAGLSACQGGEESRPAEEAEPSPQTAETSGVESADAGEAKKFAAFPFTVEDLREATKPGRSFTLKFEMPGVKTTYHKVEFLSVDEEGATTRGTNWSLGGERKQTEEEHVTWEELQAHASYPLDTTTIRVDRIQTELGTFPCLLYEQIGSDGQPTARVWFAIELPGAPILTEDLTNGEVTFRALMVESVMP